jgi:glycosyltransferase involved in cell wall biosynthesis
MRVFIEKKLNQETGRGPGKFLVRLLTALNNIGVTCQFSSFAQCDLSLALSWWPSPNLNIPRVVRVDGLSVKPGQHIKEGYIRKLYRNIQGCDGIIWQSLFSQKVVGAILGVTAPNEFIIHNGVEPHPCIAKVGSSDYKHVILCSNWLRSTGSTRAIKRLKFMLDVGREYAKKRPDVIFWIAGKNNYTHIKHPNIRFLGNLKNDQLDKYTYSANCCLFLGCYDACPNSIVECMVIGTPVICVNGSGPEELVKMGYGEVLPIDRSDDMLHGRIAPLDPGAIMAALDRWVDCTDKKPARSLFINEVAQRYKAAFERVLCR